MTAEKNRFSGKTVDKSLESPPETLFDGEEIAI